MSRSGKYSYFFKSSMHEIRNEFLKCTFPGVVCRFPPLINTFIRSFCRWLQWRSSLFSACESLECPWKHLFCPRVSISKRRYLLASVNNAHISPPPISHPQIHCVWLPSSWQVGESLTFLSSAWITPGSWLHLELPSEHRLGMNLNLAELPGGLE